MRNHYISAGSAAQRPIIEKQPKKREPTTTANERTSFADIMLLINTNKLDQPPTLSILQVNRQRRNRNETNNRNMFVFVAYQSITCVIALAVHI